MDICIRLCANISKTEMITMEIVYTTDGITNIARIYPRILVFSLTSNSILTERYFCLGIELYKKRLNKDSAHKGCEYQLCYLELRVPDTIVIRIPKENMKYIYGMFLCSDKLVHTPIVVKG